MSEFRYNMISREWVIIATERAKRPEDFKRKKDIPALPEHKAACPFCLCNEGDGKDETYRVGDEKSWKVRSIYNKFPALSPEQENVRNISGFYNSIKGFGVHEVIVENPRHNAVIATMGLAEVKDIIKTYRDRYSEIGSIKGVEAITIFKNHGPMAGSSQEHPHSQLVATPVVPPLTRNRFEQAARYFDVMGRCVFCEMVERELKEGVRIVLETEKFVSFVPYASALPFIVWILPKRHTASFGDIDEKEETDLAAHLQSVLIKLYKGLDNPDFNYTIRSTPIKEYNSDYFHWAINIVPRITQPAGFELGSGIFINSSLPEKCAEFLREIK